MKTKKIILSLIAPIALFCLTGCHGAKSLPAFEVPESFDESKNYELTFWAKNDNNAYQTAIYEKAVNDFEKLYPNVKVNMRLYTDYSLIYNDVITNISTGTTPNICITYPDNIATYMAGPNTVINLDTLFFNEKYGLKGSDVRFNGPSYEEIVPEFLNECILADGHYAVPYMRSSEACYINEDFVKALGYEVPDVLTWDFIWEVADKATEQNADGTYKLNNQNVMIPFIYKSTDNMMIQYLKQAGADYSDSEGNILLFNDTTKELLKTVCEHTKKGTFSTFKISSYPGNFLNAGQCVFAIDSTAGATWMGSRALLLDISEDKLVDFETVVRPIPQLDPENPVMISQGPSVCIFNKEDPDEVLASWLFTQYLLTNDIQIPYSQTEGYVPVTKCAQESPEYKTYLSIEDYNDEKQYPVKIQATNLLINNINNTFVTPVFNGSASLRAASGDLIESVVKGVRRKQNVDDKYIDALFKETVALHHLNSVTGTNVAPSDLGPLPIASRVLLLTLVIVWVLIGLYYLREKNRSRKQK